MSKAAHFAHPVGVSVMALKHSPAIWHSNHSVRDTMCLWRNLCFQLLYTDSCHDASKTERNCARPTDGKATCGFLHDWFYHCQNKGHVSDQTHLLWGALNMPVHISVFGSSHTLWKIQMYLNPLLIQLLKIETPHEPRLSRIHRDNQWITCLQCNMLFNWIRS